MNGSRRQQFYLYKPRPLEPRLHGQTLSLRYELIGSSPRQVEFTPYPLSRLREREGPGPEGGESEGGKPAWRAGGHGPEHVPCR